MTWATSGGDTAELVVSSTNFAFSAACMMEERWDEVNGVGIDFISDGAQKQDRRPRSGSMSLRGLPEGHFALETCAADIAAWISQLLFP